jgi:hypothetical protein
LTEWRAAELCVRQEAYPDALELLADYLRFANGVHSSVLEGGATVGGDGHLLWLSVRIGEALGVRIRDCETQQQARCAIGYLFSDVLNGHGYHPPR